MKRRLGTFSVFLGLSLAWMTCPGDVLNEQEHTSHDHSAHQKMMNEKRINYSRSIETYQIPEISLTNHEGQEINLDSMLRSPEPVAVNFIFTTCTTICPVMTATFSQMRKALGEDADGLQLISISIDPEYDTPSMLKKYADRYKAGERWQFLTGDATQIVTVLKAFDAYVGNKMNHRPLTFFSVPGSDEWVRIDGLTSGADLANEYRQLLAP